MKIIREFFDKNKKVDTSIEYIEETEELAEGLTWAIEIYNNIGDKIFYKTNFSD